MRVVYRQDEERGALAADSAVHCPTRFVVGSDKTVKYRFTSNQ